jgi:antitoxin component YwqK of YwqJK toxin-antitoxin module
MNLLNNLRIILLEDLALQIHQLKDKYVGKDKPMTESDFEKIQEIAGGKFNYIAWLSKRVGTGLIKAEDVYKYKEYFDLFEKNKKKFTHKDINLYKTAEDIQKFLDEVVSVREGDIVFDEIVGKDNFVSKNEIEKLESTGGAKYLGVFENKLKDKIIPYQVFQIYGVNQQTWKLYRDILGKCKGRRRGARIDICTIGSYNYFKQYLKDPKGSNYFVLYNLDDPKSPYQLHYESGQFMDKNDSSRIGIDQLKFFEFVGDRVPRYSLDNENFPGDFEIPVKGKGFRDEKGKNQGIWKEYDKGRVRGIYTYKNGVPVGPFVTYERDGKIFQKGTFTGNGKTGPYEEYDDGKLMEKGEYDSDGKRIGIWHFNENRKMVDFSAHPPQISGFTKSGKLLFTAQANVSRYQQIPTGDVVMYYPTESVAAVGKIGVSGRPLGFWTYYYPNGEIRAEGMYLRGQKTGIWTDVVRINGKKKIFVADYENARRPNKVKVYDSEGKFIETMKWFDIPNEYLDNQDIRYKLNIG